MNHTLWTTLSFPRKHVGSSQSAHPFSIHAPAEMIVLLDLKLTSCVLGKSGWHTWDIPRQQVFSIFRWLTLNFTQP